MYINDKLSSQAVTKAQHTCPQLVVLAAFAQNTTEQNKRSCDEYNDKPDRMWYFTRNLGHSIMASSIYITVQSYVHCVTFSSSTTVCVCGSRSTIYTSQFICLQLLSLLHTHTRARANSVLDFAIRKEFANVSYVLVIRTTKA